MSEKMFNFETFAGGALAEQLNTEIGKVLSNIYDPNTDEKKSRKVTLSITFKPTAKRKGAIVSIAAKSTLAPAVPSETSIIIDKDLRTGDVLAAEYTNQLKGQVEMDIPEADEVPIGENVLDLRKKTN